MNIRRMTPEDVSIGLLTALDWGNAVERDPEGCMMRARVLCEDPNRLLLVAFLGDEPVGLGRVSLLA